MKQKGGGSCNTRGRIVVVLFSESAKRSRRINLGFPSTCGLVMKYVQAPLGSRFALKMATVSISEMSVIQSTSPRKRFHTRLLSHLP
jgi:hypothetical protein